MNLTGIEGYRDFSGLARRRSRPTQQTAGESRAVLPRARSEPRAVRASCRTGPVFLRNLRRRRPEPGLDRKMLFLLATAKLNQAERFGVGLGETYGRNSDENLPPENVHISELEEHYHTRLLAYALDVFDLTFQVVPPPFVMRQFVKTGVFLPERLGFMFVGAAEMAGSHHVRRTTPRRRRTVRRRTEVARRIELLYSEILTDEIGHVGYCASRCTSAERAVMRRIYPFIGRLFARQTVEISLLVDPKSLHARLGRPFDADELAASLDNETYLVTHPEVRGPPSRDLRRRIRAGAGRRRPKTVRTWRGPPARPRCSVINQSVASCAMKSSIDRCDTAVDEFQDGVGCPADDERRCHLGQRIAFQLDPVDCAPVVDEHVGEPVR